MQCGQEIVVEHRTLRANAIDIYISVHHSTFPSRYLQDLTRNRSQKKTVSSLDPYTKVLALTQGLLNKSFIDLKTAYPDLPAFRYNDEAANISLDIGAPSIRFKDSSKFYLTTPMNGTIEFLALKDKAILTNWDVTGEFDISQLAAISGTDTYKLPNLSIEWLYTIFLSLVENGYNPDFQVSKCAESPAPGAAKINLQQWFTQNAHFQTPILDIFKQWPLQMKAKGYNAAGLQVTLAPPSTSSEKTLDVGAEYEAIKSLIYQEDRRGTSQDSTGLNGILVCGGDAKSLEPKVGPSEASIRLNFSKQSLSPATQAYESGLFMLSYQNLLERIIIPELLVLNEATELSIALPKRENWGTVQATYEPVYGLKRNFVQDPGVAPAASPRKFERVEVTDGTTMYKWGSSNEVLSETKEASEGCPKQLFTTSSPHTSAITWKAGDDFMTLSFSITWKMSSKRGDDPSKPSSELSFSEVTKYSIKIRFSSANGLLTVRFFDTPSEDAAKEGVKNFTCVSEDLIGLGVLKFNERRFSANFGKFMESSLRPSITAVVDKIQAKLNAQFSWALPEKRWFKFQYPTLTAKGDFLSEITCLLPRNSNLFKAVPLKLPKPKPDPAPQPEPEPVPRKNDLLLTWTLEKTEKTTLKITGTNTTYDPIGIGKLDLAFMCGLPQLLAKVEFEKKPGASEVPSAGSGYVSVVSLAVAGIDVSSKDYIKWNVAIKPKSNLLTLEEDEAIVIQIETKEDLQSSGS